MGYGTAHIFSFPFFPETPVSPQVTMPERGNGSYMGRKQQVILQGMKSATKFWSRNECHPRLFGRIQES